MISVVVALLFCSYVLLPPDPQVYLAQDASKFGGTSISVQVTATDGPNSAALQLTDNILPPNGMIIATPTSALSKLCEASALSKLCEASALRCVNYMCAVLPFVLCTDKHFFDRIRVLPVLPACFRNSCDIMLRKVSTDKKSYKIINKV